MHILGIYKSKVAHQSQPHLLHGRRPIILDILPHNGEVRVVLQKDKPVGVLRRRERVHVHEGVCQTRGLQDLVGLRREDVDNSETLFCLAVI